MLRLAHAGPREAVVNLPETVRPALGATASAILYGGDLRVLAHLRQLSDSADPRTRTFEARYVMTGSGADAPLGATVTVALEEAPLAQTLSVPLGAIDNEGHGPGVWLVGENTTKVAYRPVQVQSFGEDVVEIRGDLQAGETIVATGGHELHEGEQVRPVAARAVMR